MKRIFEKIVQNYQLITGIAAILISCIALLQTSISLSMQRNHNYKSVKPIANFIMDHDNYRARVILKNSGLGPLVVENLSIYKPKDRSTEKGNLIKWLDEIVKSSKDSTWFYEVLNHYSGIKDATGSVILPGESIDLVHVYCKNSQRFNNVVLPKIMWESNKLVYELQYTDIYDNPMPLLKTTLSKYVQDTIYYDPYPEENW